MLPSRRRREASCVPIRPVGRPIDGGGVFGLACRSLGPARSTREEAAHVLCGMGLLGQPVTENGCGMGSCGSR
jgi:hypothetical protein